MSPHMQPLCQTARFLLPPFPEYTRGEFREASLEGIPDVIIKQNYKHPSNPKPPIRYAPPCLPHEDSLIIFDPLAPQLAALDKIDEETDHPLMDDIIADWCEDEYRIKDAEEILQEYIHGKMGHVHVPSRRLQAVLGVRNERVFDLPKTNPRGMDKPFEGLYEYPQAVYDVGKVHERTEEEREEQAIALMGTSFVDTRGETLDVSSSASNNKDNDEKAREAIPGTAVGKGNESQNDGHAAFPPPKDKIEALFRSHFAAKIVAERSGAAIPKPFNPSSLLNRPRSPLAPTVNKLTGAGLREFLLLKGEQGLVRKRECNSITFCDFTSDLTTGIFQKKMLGHWTALREKGERIEVYEVDLQTSTINLQTGREEPRLQTWIWILISRPVLTLSDTGQSTKILTSPPKNHSSTSKNRTSYTASRGAAAALPRPAPNFPSPIPTSWIAFACPLEHITTFPEYVENVSSVISPDSLSVSWKKSDLRQDFDFSHHGIPIFEFSSVELLSALYPKGHAPKHGTQFLSVEGLGGYDHYDYCGHLAPRVYLDKLQDREEFPEKWEKNEYGEDRKAPAGLQSPKSGLWWEEFFKRVGDDKNVWEDIRNAMGRGRCRVVVQWSETESLRTTEVDLERFEGRLPCDGSPKLPAKEKNGTNGNLGYSKKSDNASKTAAVPRKRSKLGMEVMNTSPLKAGESTIGGGAELCNTSDLELWGKPR